MHQGILLVIYLHLLTFFEILGRRKELFGFTPPAAACFMASIAIFKAREYWAS
jgi:hypothetical protein